MKFGIAFFPTEYAISITELAVLAEGRGFESLWVAEHSHIPTSRATPYPAGGELPAMYSHTLDPFVALTAAAAVTSRIKVGTGVCLVIERDAIHTAKQVASVDQSSGGRFLFGIGGGWNREEMADHGTRYETRWKLLREQVEAMKQLWTEDEAEYQGDLVCVSRSWAWPKPLQKPHPPIILGGHGERTLQRVVRYADGWMPNRGNYLDRIPELQQMAKDAGRGPIPVTSYPGREAAAIERHQQAGVERGIFYVSSENRDAALRQLDELTKLVEPYQR